MVVIESDRTFIAIGGQIVGGLSADERGTPAAGLVAARVAFHLDDVRAEIPEEHAAVRPGERFGDFYNANAIENHAHSPRIITNKCGTQSGETGLEPLVGRFLA